MSNRTALAAQAIRKAWKNEQKLVKEGKGTYNWSRKQQQSIHDIGLAYDEEGYAFQGHHMQSVERYPDYQGDPENIQFLSKADHLAAHNGSFRNSTNGFYNPETKTMESFNGEKYVPCRIILLTDPVFGPNNMSQDFSIEVQESQDYSAKKQNQHNNSNEQNEDLCNTREIAEAPKPPFMMQLVQPDEEKGILNTMRLCLRGFRNWCSERAQAYREWHEEHEEEIAIAKGFIGSAGRGMLSLAEQQLSYELEAMEDQYYAEIEQKRIATTDAPSQDDIPTADFNTDTVEDNALSEDLDTDNVSDHKSPHIRKGHIHHYWTGPKNGDRILIEKWIDDIHVNEKLQDEDSSADN